jgi:hypothetical protein
MNGYPQPDGEPSPGNQPGAIVFALVVGLALFCLVVGILGGWG